MAICFCIFCMILLVVKVKMKVLSVIEKFDLQFTNFGLAVPRVEVKAQAKEVMQILKMWVPYG